jgi:hypothetical protein
MMLLALDWAQVTSVILAVLTIVYAVKEIRIYRDSSYWLIPIILWQILTLIFYLALNLDRLKIVDTPFLFTDLSTILRLTGQISIAGVVVTWHLVHRKTNGGAK